MFIILENIINELIDELKQCDTTYNNVRDLAALYEVRDRFENNEESIKQTEVEKELSDILPAYEKYVEVKTKFQLTSTEEENMVYKLKLLCIEIFDLLKILYTNTNTDAERSEIRRCITRLTEEIWFPLFFFIFFSSFFEKTIDFLKIIVYNKDTIKIMKEVQKDERNN